MKSYFLENSWTCPGRNDVVIVHDKKKEKKKRQKHYMLTTLKKDYSSIKTENLGCKICFSKFCDMRPDEVRYPIHLCKTSHIHLVYAFPMKMNDCSWIHTK